MANPIVTTVQIDSPSYSNHEAKLEGSLFRDGLECTYRGFQYGIDETPTYNIGSGVDANQDGEFQFTASPLAAYTEYDYRAYAILKVWNEELEEFESITYYGEWKSFYTNAIASVRTIIASDINKETGAVSLYGFIQDNADGKATEAGFKWGYTKTDTGTVSTATVTEGEYILNSTFKVNKDIYFRAYITTPTGTYYGEWEKFSTKDYTPNIFMTAVMLQDPFRWFLISFHNENINNAWEITGNYYGQNRMCVDSEGNIYVLDGSETSTKTLKKYTKDGAFIKSKSVGLVYNVTMHPDGRLAFRGRNSDMQYISFRDTENINPSGSGIVLSWTTNNYAYKGLVIDSEGYGYVINILANTIEKWDLVETEKIAEKIAEQSLTDVEVETYNYLAIIGDYIFSNGYGNQSWIVPKSLESAPTEWTPSGLDYFRSAGNLGNNLLVSGILISDYTYGMQCYDISKNFKWETDVGFNELDFYSIAGKLPYAELSTISAERSSVYANVILTGEIVLGGNSLTKRGFEYIIQDEEPAEEDEGTEILEDEEVEGEGFDNEEYEIHTGDDLRTLYNLDNDNEDWEATTIWWFRAIGYDNSDTKYYGDWMKNVPTVTTGTMTNQLVLNSIPTVLAHGELTDKGANDVTQRGFRIIKEYQGDLLGADFYIGVAFGDFSIMVEMESHTVLGGDDGYTVIDYYWTGTFYRDSVEEGDFDLEEFERTLGGGLSFEGLGIYLKPNDTYKIQAMAKNDLGWAFGEQVEVTTLAGTSIDLDDDKLDSTKFEKTVTLGIVPTGCEVTRVGIRLGRTKSCNELHYFQDGSWGTGESVTFMVELEPDSTYYIMPYIVIDYGDYEEEILGMLNYTDPDMEDEYLSNFPVEVTDDIEEDEEKTTQSQTGQGNYSYRSINKKIECEKIGYQGLIDYYGRRRAYTVTNHLIQTKSVCCVIISNYLDKFQRLKLKVAIDIDMPIPFEEQDVILLGDGKTLFKADTQGTILFQADGEGELEQRAFILAKIRKIGATFESGGSTIIPIELEV